MVYLPITIFFLGCASAALIPDPLGDVKNGGKGRLGIYGGNTTTIKNHPYVASLVYNDTPFCAATIVSQKWVITFAICIVDEEVKNVSVVVGSNNGVTGARHKIAQVVVHPKMNFLDYNVAAIKVVGKIKFNNKVQKINLPTSSVKANTWLDVAGYGNDAVESSDKIHLREGTLKWTTAAKCNATFAEYELSWTPRLGCAQNKGKTTLCMGDYGDALVKDGVFYAFFMISLGDDCTKNALPGIYTNVYEVADWINETISG